MTGRGILSTAGRRRILALLLLLPFLAFALVKPGTMLATDAQGRVMVVLCGDSLPVEMAVAADGNLVPVKELPGQGLKHGACDWALHGQTVLAAGGIDLPSPHRAAMAIRLEPAETALVLARMRLTPGARGPPVRL